MIRKQNAMRLLHALFFSILILFSNTTIVSGQKHNRIHEQLRFKKFTVDEGFTNNRVRGLSQDKYGFMWFGTRQGVTRYDGYELKKYLHYYHKQTDSVGIIMTETNEGICDSSGTPWIIGQYGICYYNREVDKFIRFNPSNFDVEINQGGGLTEDQYGNIWFATNIGILKHNPYSGENKLFQHEKKNPNSIPGGAIFKVLEDSRGLIWYSIKTAGGAGYIDPKSGIIKYYEADGMPGSLAENNTEKLYEDSQHNVWIGHNSQGASKYDFKTETFKVYFPDPALPNSGRVRGMIEDSKGNFWFGTMEGLYIFDPETETFFRYAHANHPISQLSHNSVQNMFIDDHDGLWVGTHAGGVVYTNLYTSGFVKYEYSSFDNEYYLNNNNVYGLSFDRNENIWVATENGGVNFLNRATGKFTYFTHNPITTNSLLTNNIKCVYIGNNHLVYIGTYRGGMSIFNQKNNTFKHLLKTEQFPQGIDDEGIFDIYPDVVDTNILWIATTNRVYMYKKKEVEFIQITENTPGFENSRTLTRLWSICHTNDHKMIFGGSHGIAILDRDNNNFRYVDEIEGTPVSSVDFAIIDKKGFLWAAINLSKIIRYDLFKREYIVFDKHDGLPEYELIQAQDDRLGNLWISTNQGILKLENIINSVDDFKIVHYDNSDNLQSLEFLYNSSDKSPSGEILFGGINGFNSFMPENVNPNPFVPKVAITKLSVVNREVTPGEEVEGKVLLDKHILETKSLDFHHKIKIFSFTYAGFHFVAPENNKFRYILKNYDKEWTEEVPSSIRTATYSNLPRGKYTFMVDASNNNGRFSENPATIDIRIRPPFWLTWWFISIAVLFLIGLIILFIRIRERQLKKDRAHLLAELDKGNQELTQQKEEITMQRQEIRTRDREERYQRWYNQGLIKLNEVITTNKEDENQLAKLVIATIVRYIEVQQGVIYLINDETEQDEDKKFLKLTGAYGVDKNKLQQDNISINEGHVGACYRDGETTIINNAPEGYMVMESGLGKKSLSSITLIPLKFEGYMIGIMEFASLRKMKSFKIDFLENVANNISNYLYNARQNNRVKQLYERSQQQSEELQAQEEELRQNMEEMQATQDELLRKQHDFMNETAMFETLLNFLQDRITIKDTESVYLRINKVKSDALKLKNPNEATGKTDADFFGKEHFQRALTEEKKLIKAGKPIFNQEEQIKFKDGRVQWGSTSRIPFRNSKGDMVGTLIITKNITDEKLWKGFIGSQKIMMKDFSEKYPVICYECDHLGNITNIYGNGLDRIGVKDSEALDKNLFVIFKELKKELKINELNEKMTIEYKINVKQKSYTISHLILKNEGSGGIVACANVQED